MEEPLNFTTNKDYVEEEFKWTEVAAEREKYWREEFIPKFLEEERLRDAGRIAKTKVSIFNFYSRFEIAFIALLSIKWHLFDAIWWRHYILSVCSLLMCLNLQYVMKAILKFELQAEIHHFAIYL